MDQAPKSFLDRLLDGLQPPLLWRFLCRPRTRLVLSWLIAGGMLLGLALYAWVAFDEPARTDGNSGHVQIDFGGQWLLARMLVEGHGRDLYNRDIQRRVLQAAYPTGDQAPDAVLSDAEQLMDWMMGRDAPPAERSVGGPLYPPIHALFHYPIGLFPPRIGYRVLQLSILLLTLLTAYGIHDLSQGRIWWSVAAIGIMAYPGYSAALNLGQNPVLTLAILVWGWRFLVRGREGSGGLVWALLAFKPVWAAAFFLVLLLSRRWRACAAMLGGGLVLVVITLPLVGEQSWRDWLAVGREASQLYNVDENWIRASRDLLSIPRRWLIDFHQLPTARDRHWLAPALLGWSLLVLVLEITVRLAVYRRHEARAGIGPPAAFLLLGAWLTCFHFMYYDVLLTVLPVFLLFTEPRRYLERVLLGAIPASQGVRAPAVQDYFQPYPAEMLPTPWPLLQRGAPSLWILNRMTPTLVVLLLLTLYVPACFRLTADRYPPLDTYVLLALWLWSGWRWAKEGAPEDLAQSATQRRHSDVGS